ncbi:hypothetical protein RDI58_028727 [Solanum bulbocastanum]|uniref:Uncharacterized protein n=1 Tax=Solanum bulbocastanum TaxID=147425 RepID=A0AAN8SPD8_SOLBU
MRNCSRVSHIEHGINGVGEVEQPLEEENGNSLDFEEDDLDDVPDQDDSEVDKELGAFREKLEEEKKMKEAGIDKRFENIFTNKAAKYNEKLEVMKCLLIHQMNQVKIAMKS